MELTGIGGLIILIADIYAIIMILQSGAKTPDKVIWYFAGPGKKPF